MTTGSPSAGACIFVSKLQHSSVARVLEHSTWPAAAHHLHKHMPWPIWLPYQIGEVDCCLGLSSFQPPQHLQPAMLQCHMIRCTAEELPRLPCTTIATRFILKSRVYMCTPSQTRPTTHTTGVLHKLTTAVWRGLKQRSCHPELPSILQQQGCSTAGNTQLLAAHPTPNHAGCLIYCPHQHILHSGCVCSCHTDQTIAGLPFTRQTAHHCSA